MTQRSISAHVLEFLAEKIDTVPQLETLLLMWKEPDRLWTSSDIAARVYVSPGHARSTLQALQRRQLVTVEGDPPLYRYSDRWDKRGGLMSEVAAEYARNLVPITMLIHRGASSSVKEFARAFDLKKDR
jgi:hypothetical protein